MDRGDSTKDFHEKLDLDAPILSTRRLVNCRNVALKTDSGRETGASGFHTRGCVPFLWERAPGLAKDVQGGGSHENDVPPPKPPPNQWHPSHMEYSDEDGFSITNENYDNLAQNDLDEDVFTDAMDVISLSESFDRACSTCTAANSSSLTPEALKSAGNLSPNFIIRRFLPAANALAFSSYQAPPKNLHERSSPRHQNGHPRESSKSFSSYQSTNISSALEGGPRVVVRSYSPPKACGLEVFSPLRLKHVLCGLKSSIRTSPPRVKRRQKPTNGASFYGSKRKRGKTETKALASEGESSIDRLDARSAPEFSRQAWQHAPLNSPTQSWRSHGYNGR
ncbi:uncharacterized protein [Aristolochia californica]|uniref:uncharacterized protein n=1 Tax=Aristolochia californica TaxID=171875 RepID=UPI0035D77B36